MCFKMELVGVRVPWHRTCATARGIGDSCSFGVINIFYSHMPCPVYLDLLSSSVDVEQHEACEPGTSISLPFFIFIAFCSRRSQSLHNCTRHRATVASLLSSSGWSSLLISSMVDCTKSIAEEEHVDKSILGFPSSIPSVNGIALSP